MLESLGVERGTSVVSRGSRFVLQEAKAIKEKIVIALTRR